MAAATAVGGSEIVAVDAMQVYRRMDIGTAKPDVRGPGTGPPSLPRPRRAVRAVHRRRLPGRLSRVADRERWCRRSLLVAGTGLYLTAVIDGLELPGEWPEIRAELDAADDIAGLHRRLAALDPVAADRIDPGNRRRIVRALEVCLGSGRPFSSFGPGVSRYAADRRRAARAALATARARCTHRSACRGDGRGGPRRRGRPDCSPSRAACRATARQALGYKELIAHLEDGVSLDEAIDTVVRRTRQFAVRQERWFRRDPRIRWIDIEARPGGRGGAGRDRGATQLMTTTRSDRQTITLTKHHGLANDFLVTFDVLDDEPSEFARAVCDRHRGIGADGLLIGEPADGYDARDDAATTPMAAAPR